MILERLQGVPAAFLYFVFREGKRTYYTLVFHIMMIFFMAYPTLIHNYVMQTLSRLTGYFFPLTIAESYLS